MNEAADNRPWQRSSSCSDSACVEVDTSLDVVRLRNSKEPGRVVEFDPAEWKAFLDGVRRGEF
jgi:hypothetical protein